MKANRPYVFLLVVVPLIAGLPSCDSVRPEHPGALVVEAFLNTGAPPPPITLRSTLRLAASADEAAAAAASGAIVDMKVDGEKVAYAERSGGVYAPLERSPRSLVAGDDFELTVQWEGILATAVGAMPPSIWIDSVTVSAPAQPVEAVLIDTLRRDTLGVDATTGFLYPVETSVWWTPAQPLGEESWIEAQLRPRREFSSVVVDFFLLPEEVFPESEAAGALAGTASWRGLYAVPVASGDDPLPAHELRIALARSGEDYADFAASRTGSDGREPPSNVSGALGIAAGLSVDSVTVHVDPGVAGGKTRVFER